MKSSRKVRRYLAPEVPLLCGILICTLVWPGPNAYGANDTTALDAHHLVRGQLVNPLPQSSILGRRLTIEMGSRPSDLQPIFVGGKLQLSSQRADDAASSSKHRAKRPPTPRGGTRLKYFITDVGTLGGTQSYALGINDLGQVFGTSWITGDMTGHAFLYTDGSMTDLGPLWVTLAGGAINNSGQIAVSASVNGVVTPAIYDSRSAVVNIIPGLGGLSTFGLSGVTTSVNNRGEAVGFSYVDTNTAHAFLYYNGATTDIGSFGGSGHAFSINESGTIVGSATDMSNGYFHAFVYTNNVMTDIDPFGDSDFSKSLSSANDINALGQVVGYFLNQDDATIHTFIYDRGTFTDIGSGGSPETHGSAINDRSQVVGVYLVPDDPICLDVGTGESCFDRHKMHAFLYEAEALTDLNALIPSDSDWELTWAFDINNYGQIVGYGVLNGSFRGFLLTPAVDKKQCKNAGWKKFGFKNQGRCIQFINTGE